MVHDPLRNDMFVAVRGGGATRNGKRIAVSAQRHLRTSLLSTQVQSDDPAVLDRYSARLRAFLRTRRARCARSERRLWRLRTCRADGLTRSAKTTGPLVHSAWHVLLIKEAAVVHPTFDGTPRPLDQRADILATNGHLHEQLIRILSNSRGGSVPSFDNTTGRQST